MGPFGRLRTGLVRESCRLRISLTGLKRGDMVVCGGGRNETGAWDGEVIESESGIGGYSSTYC